MAAAAALQGRRVRSGCVQMHLVSHHLSHQPNYCMSSKDSSNPCKMALAAILNHSGWSLTGTPLAVARTHNTQPLHWDPPALQRHQAATRQPLSPPEPATPRSRSSRLSWRRCA